MNSSIERGNWKLQMVDLTKPDGFGKVKLLKKTGFGDQIRMYIVNKHGAFYHPMEYIGTCWQHGKRKEGKLAFFNGLSRAWNQSITAYYFTTHI